MSRSGKMMTALKEELRKQMLKKRSGLAREYSAAADQAILKRLFEMPAYRKAKAVFTYVSKDGETDTRELIEHGLAQGKTVAVPRCTGEGLMKAYRIYGMEDLEEGHYRILEPKTSCQEIQPESIDLAVVPCVSCGYDGRRLGYGGGYYDRYLTLTPALRVALCREQLMCDMIPSEIYDCAMDLVITEKGIWPGLEQ